MNSRAIDRVRPLFVPRTEGDDTQALMGPPEHLPRVAVLGLRQVGQQLARQLVDVCPAVTLHDPDPERAVRVRDTLIVAGTAPAGDETVSVRQAGLRGQRLHIEPDFDALGPHDIVFDTEPVDGPARQRRLVRLERLVDARTLLVVQGSSVPLTRLAEVCALPGRLVGLQLHPVTADAPALAEVIVTPHTDPDIVSRLLSLCQQANIQAVRVFDEAQPPGVLQRLAAAALEECGQLLEERVVTAAQLDQLIWEQCPSSIRNARPPVDTASGSPSSPTADAASGGPDAGPGQGLLAWLHGCDRAQRALWTAAHPSVDWRLPTGSGLPAAPARPAVVAANPTATVMAWHLVATEADLPRLRDCVLALGGTIAGSTVCPLRGTGTAAESASVAPVAMPVPAPVGAAAPPPDTTGDGDNGEAPATGYLLAPWGEDATTLAALMQLPPSRCVAVDLVFDPCAPGVRRRVLMPTPVTTPDCLAGAVRLFGVDGVAVAVFGESSGFVAPRLIARMVAVATQLMQRHRLSATEVDLLACLGLGYAAGPMQFAAAIGPLRLLRLMQSLDEGLAGPRYTPAPWWRRCATLQLAPDPLTGSGSGCPATAEPPPPLSLTERHRPGHHCDPARLRSSA